MKEYNRSRDKIRNFIQTELGALLEEDQKKLKIVSEGDLQSCAYFHLRDFFDDQDGTY